MKFRTEIKLVSQQENQLDYSSKVLLLGSCFSENIGDRLSYYRFNTLINPFGILFSPTAIHKVLEATVAKKVYSEKDLVKQGDLYHCLEHHSDMSALTKDEVLKNIQLAQNNCLTQLSAASHVIITLGTSWVYQYIKTGELVANCHKISQTEFEKKILSVDEVTNNLEQIVLNVRKVNPSSQIIFTVSPVRHLKDGMIENSLSKAHLLAAVGKIVNGGNATCFGSYEIMMDDLRDYRFYEADMIHPNTVAIDYIWEQFSHVWISDKAKTYFKRIASIQQSLLHKPFQPNSESHQDFLEKLAIKQRQLEYELNIHFNA